MFNAASLMLSATILRNVSALTPPSETNLASSSPASPVSFCSHVHTGSPRSASILISPVMALPEV